MQDWDLELHLRRRSIAKYYISKRRGDTKSFTDESLPLPLKILLTSISSSYIDSHWGNLILKGESTTELSTEDLVIDTANILQKSGLTSAFIIRSIVLLICTIEHYNIEILKRRYRSDQNLIVEFSKLALASMFYPTTYKTVSFIIEIYKDTQSIGDFEKSLLKANDDSEVYKALVFEQLCEIWERSPAFYFEDHENLGPIFSWIDEDTEYKDLLLRKNKIKFMLGVSGDEDDAIRSIIGLGMRGHYESWVTLQEWAQHEGEQKHILNALISECTFNFTNKELQLDCENDENY